MVYANAYCRWREWDANIRGRFRSANKSGDLTVLDNPKFHPLPLRLSSPPSLSLWEFLGEQVYSNDLLPFLDPFPLSREFIWKYRKQRQRGSVANVGHFFSSHFLITSFLFLLVPLPGILFSPYFPEYRILSIRCLQFAGMSRACAQRKSSLSLIRGIHSQKSLKQFSNLSKLDTNIVISFSSDSSSSPFLINMKEGKIKGGI